MSQVTHPTHPKLQFGAQLRAHRRLVLAALLALLATAGVVLALALSENQSTTTTVSDQPVPAVRGDGGPEETAVAASVGSRSAGRPDESKVAAAISYRYVNPSTGYASPATAGRPDESAIAAGISGR